MIRKAEKDIDSNLDWVIFVWVSHPISVKSPDTLVQKVLVDLVLFLVWGSIIASVLDKSTRDLFHLKVCLSIPKPLWFCNQSF